MRELRARHACADRNDSSRCQSARERRGSRRQFPVRIAFAMTINKAQGQTLDRVGVYLPDPCFAHGQLYVAASRVGLPMHIRFAVGVDTSGEYRTRNVVYVEALTCRPCCACLPTVGTAVQCTVIDYT